MSENKETQAAASTAAIPVIYGTKTGMTRIYDDEGRSIPVTVVSLKDNTVITQVKTSEKDGYTSVQLGFKAKKAQRVNKAEKGHFQKAGAPGFYFVEEFRLPKADPALAVGAAVSTDFLTAGLMIDVQGTTKGKGLQGVVKKEFGVRRRDRNSSASKRAQFLELFLEDAELLPDLLPVLQAPSWSECSAHARS